MRSTRHISCALALAASLALPAFAQGTSPSNSSEATRSTGTTSEMSLRDNDRGFDWGWLGLFGLVGLLGMRKQPDVHRTDTTRPAMPR